MNEIARLTSLMQNFTPHDAVEQTDKVQILSFLAQTSDALTRENTLGHFVGSAFIVNPARDRAVMVYHNIFQGWIFPGGHADGDADLLRVAMREAKEETGLDVTPLLDGKIFGAKVDPIEQHFKHGKPVSAHLHFNVIYLLEADDRQPLQYRAEESQGAKWFSLADFTNPELVVPLALPAQIRLVEKLQQLKK